MIDCIRSERLKEVVKRFLDRALQEPDTSRQVVRESARQVVDSQYVVSRGGEHLRHVRPDEAGGTRDDSVHKVVRPRGKSSNLGVSCSVVNGIVSAGSVSG